MSKIEKNLESVKKYLKGVTGKEVSENEIGMESVILHREEIDADIVSLETIRKFPDAMMFHFYEYQDKSNWIIGLATKVVNADNPFYFVCIKDGERIQEEWIEIK